MPAQQKIFICGDSFSSLDSKWPNFHWSERLQKMLPQYTVINLAYSGASNLSVCSQIEKAASNANLAMIIVNASDLYRIDLPNNKFQRKNKTGSVHISQDKYSYNDFKKIAEKIYTEIYKNSFVSPEDFYDLFDHNYSPDYQSKDSAVISSFGMWSLTKELGHDHGSVFAKDVLDSAVNYFRFMFDLNIRFHTDLGLIEGKLYKLYAKQIPFLYNLGGLTNKKSFLNRVFPHVIKQVEAGYADLEPFKCDINLFDVEEDSHITDRSAPGFHIANDSAHQKIAEYYNHRILQQHASQTNNT